MFELDGTLLACVGTAAGAVIAAAETAGAAVAGKLNLLVLSPTQSSVLPPVVWIIARVLPMLTACPTETVWLPITKDDGAAA
jgi:hypothetical protein